MKILGISALYHDSAAAIIEDGNILAAVQEERFSRIKHDNSLPVNAINYCLGMGDCSMSEVDAVVYYDQPLLTLDRFLKNCIGNANLGKEDWLIDNSFSDVISSRMGVDRNIRKRYGRLGKQDKLFTCEHHVSHAASAFFPSPFEDAAILTIDGVGEWATTTIGVGEGNSIRIIKEIDYPHSIGLIYSAFTAFCGFKVNSGDYKFMGLAPYGDPIYYDLIMDKLIDIKEDGSYRINLEYFDYYCGKYMTNDKFVELFGGEPRKPESRITLREMNIASSMQKVTEELILGLAEFARKETGKNRLVMAGGVALNCVANGKIVDSGIFEDLWIQPAAGDAGGALGCALYYYYNLGNNREVSETDSQQGSYLGVEYSNDEIVDFLDKNSYPFTLYSEKNDLYKTVAKALQDQCVVGWFQGRMEFGPRALGNRSILGDPRSKKMQSELNLKIKFRESFRPFAPAVLEDNVGDYFESTHESPYMLLVTKVKKEIREPFDKNEFIKRFSGDMLPIVNEARSSVPAITHIDYSARVQTVSRKRNERFYDLIKEFERLTGCGMLINTSFNVRGEPIVCSPADAYMCFMRTNMDMLVLNDCVLWKKEQPVFEDVEDWRSIYELD